MKTFTIILTLVSSFICFLFTNLACAKSNIAPVNLPPFFSSIKPLSPAEQQNAKKYTWHPGCPVSLNDLVSIKISYFGFDNQAHQGTLIVNKNVAAEVVNMFAALYQQKFPIQKMIPADYYQGDDNKIMADNDTSAFSCRAITGNATKFSLHSYGTAIDINPLINPYVKQDIVLPPVSKIYLDRTKITKGMIVKNDNVYNIFIQHGWEWGGDWKSLKDYQHFEKNLQKDSN